MTRQRILLFGAAAMVFVILAVLVASSGAEAVDTVRGDVSCDGYVDSADGLLVKMVDAGLIEESALGCGSFGDINGNERLDVIDALLILQFDAGLFDEFP